jgi:hypothetical protein
MKVGDLVREKTRMSRRPETGIVLKVDYDQHTDGHYHPFQVYFSDGETNWMRGKFLETISENRRFDKT